MSAMDTIANNNQNEMLLDLDKKTLVSQFRNNPSSILKVFQEAIATTTNSYQQSQSIQCIHQILRTSAPQYSTASKLAFPQIPRYLLILIPHQNPAQA
ncbi:hypothetical protein H5410_038114 [Solanum commersonii]|uniref:Uncharacterized protein n=1 Tax=Solanum commersonii TaxID=4109 RepID=A0A9J5Y9T8_SOLCO|nr:hypothetical protein H5410_038114 [Solanum commersonii]